MKLRKFIVFMAFSLLFLVGCNSTGKNNNNSDIETIASWIKETVPTAIVENYSFPTTHPELGGTITWESLDLDIITSEGVITLKGEVQDTVLNFTINLNDTIKSDSLLVTVYGLTVDEVAEKFAAQFKPVILSSYEVKTDFGPGFVVNWSSSNEAVFTNYGTYIKPVNDVLLTITYSVTFNGKTVDGTKEVTVKGQTYSEKVAELKEWIETNYITSRFIDSEINLPTRFEKFGIDLKWSSSNSGVINAQGEIKQYAFDRYVSLIGETEINGDLALLEFSLVVGAKEVNTKEEKLNSLLEAIAVPEIGQLTFGAYGNINQSYNFLPFYQNVEAPVFDYIIPVNSDKFNGSRPGTKLYSLEFITIHDTANPNANGLTHAKLLKNGYPAASWHFAIDDTGAYQSIPLDEVAWHAGDGARKFELTNTGVTATTKYPKITISLDGFYVLNGTKSGLKAPLINGVRIPTTNDITPSGIYTEIVNGKYYMNTNYFNADYGKISNGGGNRNSIGIETSIHDGNDYAQTLRHTAKLSADILVKNNLSVDRVLQHNNFSGKYCPNAIRQLSYWNNFLDLVSLEKFAQSELSDMTFTWTSLSDILDSNGKIALDIKGLNKVDYTVVATDGTLNVTKSFSTTLK